MAGGIGPLSNLPGKVTASNELVVAVTGAGSGGTSSVDEAAFTAGASAGTPAMGVYEATPSTLTDGQLGIVALDADRNLKVNIAAGGGSGGTSSAFGAAFPSDGTAVGIADPGGTMKALALDTLDYDTGAGTKAQSIIGIALPGSGGAVAGGTSTNPVRVDPTGTTTQPVSAASLPLPSGAATLAEQQTQTTSLQLLDDAVSTTGSAVPAKGFQATGTDGTNARALKTDSSGELQVDVLTLPSNASVNLAQVGGTATVTGGTNGSQGVGGIQAHDAADSGNNPVKIGARATSSEPAAVASGDIANLITDLAGKLITLPYANPENFVSGVITSAMTGTTSTSLIAAPAAGLRNYITQITVSNTHASVGTNMELQDGNGGTTFYIIPASAVYGGATLAFPTPLRQPTTATAVYIKNTTTGASTFASASGYKGA